MDVLQTAGLRVAAAPNVCCGRPLISKGLLSRARQRARENVERMYSDAEAGRKFVFCEPSCLSAMREDAPSLLRGEEQRKAQIIAQACVLFEEFVETELAAGRRSLNFTPEPSPILLHGHCHQKSMGLLAPAKSLLSRMSSRIPGAAITDPDAGCCGMAGSFGYSHDHYDISRQIGERRLFPAIRNAEPGTTIVASGFSCRHQISDFTGATAIHPALLLQSRLARTR
jgi:Fe-S oxidoreductase